MQKIYLPSPEETSMELNFRDGQEPLKVDAIEVEMLVAHCHLTKPEDESFESYFASEFRKAFDRKISLTAGNYILRVRKEILEASKKNLYNGQEQLDSTEQVTVSPPDSSPSSSTPSPSSKQRKRSRSSK